MATVRRYRAVYELDESGHWIVTVPAVKGCHSYGRSINEARERIREALALFVNDAEHAAIVDRIRLPKKVEATLATFRAARHDAEHAQARAREALRRALSRLTSHGLSVRDAGELLGLSHQRVQQLREPSQARP